MIASREDIRLSALCSLGLLDTPASESFDRITRMASQIFDLPIAAISLTDIDRQWFKSRVGVEHQSIPRERAPCAEVAEKSAILVVAALRISSRTSPRDGVLPVSPDRSARLILP